MLGWINRVSLLWAFIILFALHALLYYSLGNSSWFLLALLAALVETGIIAAIQAIGRMTRSND